MPASPGTATPQEPVNPSAREHSKSGMSVLWWAGILAVLVPLAVLAAVAALPVILGWAVGWVSRTRWGMHLLILGAGSILGGLLARVWGPFPGLVVGLVTCASLAVLRKLSAANRRDYSKYVEHPRYGREPRLTGLNPNTFSFGVHIPGSWSEEIAGTAIVADPAKQNRSSRPFTHYFDLRKTCKDCRRSFIYFAEEQKYWYEALHMPPEKECVHCPACRKNLQCQHRYEELCHVAQRTPEQNLEMADCCLTLIEHGRFSQRQSERVRMLLNQMPEESQASEACAALRLRLGKLAAG